MMYLLFASGVWVVVSVWVFRHEASHALPEPNDGQQHDESEVAQ